MNKEIKTKKELLAILKRIPYKGRAHRNRIVCSLIGHSLIQEVFWNYYSCARCKEQLGDNLCSFYPMAEKIVVVGHNCPKCRKNYKKLTWKDKIFAPNPFKKSRVKK